MRLPRLVSAFLPVILLASAILLPTVAPALTSGTVNAAAAQRQTLAGHVPLWASVAGDMGPLADMPLTNLTVVLARPAATQAAFDKFVADAANPASSGFHKFLSPQQVGSQFGPAQKDVDAVTAWLAAQGLTVTQISPDRTRITFNGTSTAIARAFGSEFHRYKVHGSKGAE